MSFPVLSSRHVFPLAVKFISGLTLILGLLSTSSAEANDAPTIQSMSVMYYGGGWWGVYGFVDDEAPSDCQVFFSGVLDGCSTDVSSNGEFSLFLELPLMLTGQFGATALDPEYQWSDPASDLIGNVN